MNCLFKKHLECSCWYINCNNMRVDKANNIATVLSEVLDNPLQTHQEIANNTGLPKSTVWNAMRELGQIGSNDERLMKLVVWDITIQEKIQAEKTRRINEETDQIRNNELDQWEQTALKRSQLLSGKDTEKKTIKIEWFENMSTDEISKLVFSNIK